MSDWQVSDIAVARRDIPEAQISRGDHLSVTQVVNHKRFGPCLSLEGITYAGHPMMIQATDFLRIVPDCQGGDEVPV